MAEGSRPGLPGLERAESARVSAFAPRVRDPGSADPGPEGGARSPGARSAEPRAGVGPR